MRAHARRGETRRDAQSIEGERGCPTRRAQGVGSEAAGPGRRRRHRAEEGSQKRPTSASSGPPLRGRSRRATSTNSPPRASARRLRATGRRAPPAPDHVSSGGDDARCPPLPIPCARYGPHGGGAAAPPMRPRVAAPSALRPGLLSKAVARPPSPGPGARFCLGALDIPSSCAPSVRAPRLVT